MSILGFTSAHRDRSACVECRDSSKVQLLGAGYISFLPGFAAVQRAQNRATGTTDPNDFRADRLHSAKRNVRAGVALLKARSGTGKGKVFLGDAEAQKGEGGSQGHLRSVAEGEPKLWMKLCAGC
jgi:hypothetical protein